MNENLKLIIGLALALTCIIYGRRLLKSGAPAPEAQHVGPVVKEMRSSSPQQARGRIDWDDPAVQDAVIPPAKTKAKTPTTTADPAARAERAAARQQAIAARAERIRQLLGDDPEGVLPAVTAALDALPSVGDDADAELVWMTAVNDPDVPAEIRKALIDDLNVEGFSDPQNPTEEELPLILSRLEMIESIAPESLDETNATAFADSYKGLAKMADKVHQAEEAMNQQLKNEPPQAE
jgi:hypothetical protein